MMKKLLVILLMSLCTFVPSVYAQKQVPSRQVDSLKWRMFEGEFYNKEYNIKISLNLYDTVLVVRHYEFLGKMNGYMSGTLHETWFLTTYAISGNSATLHFSNEMGSEDQEINIVMTDSVHMTYEAVGGNAIRKAVNGKWVKLPVKMEFERRLLPALKLERDPEMPRTFRKY